MSEKKINESETPQVGGYVECVKLARLEAAEMEKKKDALMTKHRLLSLELVTIKSSVAKAELEKTNALSLFATDSISREKLDHAREVCEKELKKSLDLTELIAAVGRELKKVEAAMPDYYLQVKDAERAFWAALFMDAQRELNAMVHEKLPVAYAALAFSGSNWLGWEKTLSKIFGNEISLDDRNALATQILQKYSL